MKKVMIALTVALATLANSQAQITIPTVGGGNNGSDGGSVSPSSPFIVTNLAALTDHAELVGDVFKDVNGILVSFSASASAQSYQPSYFFAYTNKVKTLEGIMAMVTNSYASLPAVSTNGSVSISVLFYDSADQNLVRGYVGPSVGESSPSVLFEGYNGGVPQMDQYGQWVLPDYAEQIQMRLTGNIVASMTNVVTAHLVYTNSSGQYMSMDLPVNLLLQGFTFPSDWAGQGILVLGTYRFTDSGTYYDQHAYDLSATMWVYRDAAVDQDAARSMIPMLLDECPGFTRPTPARVSIQFSAMGVNPS